MVSDMAYFEVVKIDLIDSQACAVRNPLLRGDPWKGGGGAPVAAPFPRSRALVRCASSAAIRSD